MNLKPTISPDGRQMIIAAPKGHRWSKEARPPKKGEITPVVFLPDGDVSAEPAVYDYTNFSGHVLEPFDKEPGQDAFEGFHAGTGDLLTWENLTTATRARWAAAEAAVIALKP